MGMVVQHNLPAINAHRQMGINSNSLSKSLEKLSSGFAINRAADNAAGLAISEKMRGQINGLNQASKNAQDGISLIQTAEGALNETHSILQRMRELSVQSANGTYQDEVDRENISKEVEALKSEIDRISTSTHYNNIKLLDGSLSSAGASGTSYGAKFGIEVADGGVAASLEGTNGIITITNNEGKAIDVEIVANGADNLAATYTAPTGGANGKLSIKLASTTSTNNTAAAVESAIKTALGNAQVDAKVDISLKGGATDLGLFAAFTGPTTATIAGKGDTSFSGASLTSNVSGVEIKTNANGATKGGENAAWDADGKTLTLNLAENTTYTQAQIDDLIKNADVSKVASGNPANVSIKLNNGIFANGSDNTSTGKTVAGVRSASGATSIGSMTAKGNYADQITITSNNYGKEHDKNFNLVVDADAGKESVTVDKTYAISATGGGTDKASVTGSGKLDLDVNYSSNTTTNGADFSLATAVADADHAAGTASAKFVNGDVVITLYGTEDNTTGGKLAATDVSVDAINKALSELLTKEGKDPNQNKFGIENMSFSGQGGLDKVTITKGAAVTTPAQLIAKANVTPTNAVEKTNTTIHLASGVEYTEQDIENIMKKGGLDYDVKLTDSTNYDGSNTVKFDVKNTNGVTVSTTGGAGVGAEDGATNTGEGLVFQIGANGSADQRVSLNVDDMSSAGIGIKAISVGTREAANAAIGVIESAINQVAGTRADLGALQNRLEHTINSLDVASENLTASESRIRDVDMAKEMMQFSKSQILSQASQAMLAQANTLPQGVLQLLQ